MTLLPTVCIISHNVDINPHTHTHTHTHQTPHTPTNSPLLSGLANWTDITVSALGFRVGCTPARNNEQTTTNRSINRYAIPVRQLSRLLC